MEARRIIADKSRLIEASKGRPFVPRQDANKAINQMYYDDYVANAPEKESFKAGYRLFNEIQPDASR